MRHRRIAPPTLCTALVIALALSGCGDDPVALEDATAEAMALSPSLSITYQTTRYSIRDNGLELAVDSATGVLRIRRFAHGDTLYAELEDDLLESVLSFIEATDIGDKNANAMEYLNPWANLPPGMEPYSMPGTPDVEGSLGQARESLLTTMGLPSVMIRPMKQEAGAAKRITGFPSSMVGTNSSGEWDPNCPLIAHSIGEQRLAYVHRRPQMLDPFRGAFSIPAARLVWKSGKPFLTIQDLRTLFASAGVSMLERVNESWALNINRAWYNSASCQQPILISWVPPQPKVFIPPPSEEGGSGGGGYIVCQTIILMYEISFDGGGTWYPFPVSRYSCDEVDEE